MNTPPTFEEWVHYCFWQGRGHFSGIAPDSAAAIEHRERRFDVDPLTLTNYLTLLFESPAPIVNRYDERQIAGATSFIFGNESGYFGRVFSGNVPDAMQVRCLRAVATIYTDLFDRVCGRHATDPDTDLRDTNDVDRNVYMIWDMGGVELPLVFRKDHPHLVEAGINVLQVVLDTCRTSACIISALHGIGHVYCINNYEGDKAIARRVQAMVDAFVARRSLPDWILEYAAHAREGYVQ